MMMLQQWGVCFKCGDAQGPWTWEKGRWLCDSCYERQKEYEKMHSGIEACDERKGSEKIWRKF